MFDFPIIRLACYARHPKLKRAELNEVFNVKLGMAAPMFHDADPTSSIPYTQRLAATAFPAFHDREPGSPFSTEIVDTTTAGERAIHIGVFGAGNDLLFRHSECYDAAGNMTLLIVCGPAVNVAVRYESGLLTEIITFNARKYQRRIYANGALDTTCLLRRHPNGCIVGTITKDAPRATQMVTANDLMAFYPLMQAA